MSDARGPHRILRVITRLNIGGPAKQALMLTRDLGAGFVSTLIAGRSPEAEGELSDPHVRVNYIPLVRPLHPRSDAAAYKALRRTIRFNEPDLVHTHMAKAGALGRLAALRTYPRPRTVHTFHGHVLDGYFRAGSRAAFLAIERYLAAHTDVLIAVSEETRDDLLALGVGSPERWRVIRLGFDLTSFAAVSKYSMAARGELGLGEKASLVGVVGRLAPIKDHALLIRAVERLRNVHLIVVGDGELRADLERLVARSRLTERVHFLGWRKDIPEILADVDVVALSSVNEGTPVSLIEALAAGKPVVTTDVGGVRSVVRDGVDGLIVQERSATAIASCLARLLSSAEMRAAYGSAGRKRVLDVFSRERLLTDIHDLYNDLLTK